MSKFQPIPLNSGKKKLIGWDYIYQQLSPETSYGNSIKTNIGLYSPQDRADLLKEFENLSIMVESMQNSISNHEKLGYELAKVKDIRPIMFRQNNHQNLDEVDFYELKFTLLVSQRIAELYSQLELKIERIKFPDLSECLHILDPQNTKIPTFQYYPEYSQNLATIRKEKKLIENEFLRFQKEIFHEKHSKDHNSLKKIEELKKKRSQIVQQEQTEINIIRRNLSQQLFSFVDDFQQLIESLGYLDWLRVKAKLAINFRACCPKITEFSKNMQENQLVLEEMFNPYIASLLATRDKTFTPISIRFSQGVNLITGANMGGKSVTLYTTLLNILLAHCGFFVFAKSAEIPLGVFFGSIFMDNQDLSQGLSSFGAEIVNFNRFIQYDQNNFGFLFIDEFARGTNPFEGKVIFKAAVRYLQTLPWISVLTTHYDIEIDSNIHSFQVIGLKNTDLSALAQKLSYIKEDPTKSVELIQDHMDYRIIPVTSDTQIPMDAINIAQILGLNPKIIQFAKEYIQNELQKNNKSEQQYGKSKQ